MEKVKRKYTRKPKVETQPLGQQPLAVEEQPVVPVYLESFKKIGLFVYSELCDIDTLKYIKELQDQADKRNVGTQVTIMTSKQHLEPIGIRYLFNAPERLPHWTHHSLCEDVICLWILERPRISPAELFKSLAVGLENDYVRVSLKK